MVQILLMRHHGDLALSEKVGHAEGLVAGDIVMVELKDIFDVRTDMHDPAFQSLEHIQLKGSTHIGIFLKECTK